MRLVNRLVAAVEHRVDLGEEIPDGPGDGAAVSA
jgi:hypothetical protein